MQAKQYNSTVFYAEKEYVRVDLTLAGFSSPAEALFTTVRELTENALDACKESYHHECPLGVLIKIEPVGCSRSKHSYRIIASDTGCGFPQDNILQLAGSVHCSSKYESGDASSGCFGLGLKMILLYSTKSADGKLHIKTTGSKDTHIHYYTLTLDTEDGTPLCEGVQNVEKVQPFSGSEVSVIIEGDLGWAQPRLVKYFEDLALLSLQIPVIFQIYNESGLIQLQKRIECDPRLRADSSLKRMKEGVINHLHVHDKSLVAAVEKEFPADRPGHTSFLIQCSMVLHEEPCSQGILRVARFANFIPLILDSALDAIVLSLYERIPWSRFGISLKTRIGPLEDTLVVGAPFHANASNLCGISAFIHVLDPHIGFGGLRKSYLQPTPRLLSAIGTTTKEALHTLQQVRGDLLLPDDKLQAWELEHIHIPQIAQSVASIITLSKNMEFFNTCLNLLHLSVEQGTTNSIAHAVEELLRNAADKLA